MDLADNQKPLPHTANSWIAFGSYLHQLLEPDYFHNRFISIKILDIFWRILRKYLMANCTKLFNTHARFCLIHTKCLWSRNPKYKGALKTFVPITVARRLKHETPLPAPTLESWARIPLKTLMFVCTYSVFVLSFAGNRVASGWSPVQGVLPTV
jgi:hypothetical protein